MFILFALLMAIVYATNQVDYAQHTFVLVGDSETANHTGYGGCLEDFLHKSTVLNFAIGGFTTRDWLRANNTAHRNEMLKAAKDARAKGDVVICSQAFGANDEKVGTYKYVPPTKFSHNMGKIHMELKEVCTYAIITTPYIRRWYNQDGVLKPNGEEYAALSRGVANKTHSMLVDMHALSERRLSNWTPVEAYAMNLSPGDRTHLNQKACKQVAEWWADEFSKVFYRYLTQAENVHVPKDKKHRFFTQDEKVQGLKDKKAPVI
ncbi:SGNH hydrolase-type esterase domain-containing protein [Protomyces lactucae-debilis]|uniref:SGNH hydrolase-type esterase domain-containing protein n=1 Tax=Protomyces lactucae-debilis TaxID=2754530 RepID=A0A1Y2FGJ6_PROLT|nr:SGNH hydrolase-type esterase domain-containing protein [Protomyces lactucae-debilis]ORY81945.1 SGNH hydrolase-type esterase domain-containing protein [Protomyces lactucae-debilis]